MALVKVIEGVVIKYPATLADANLPNDEPDEHGRRPTYSLPANPTPEQLAEWDLYPLGKSIKPAGDKVTAVDPVLVDGNWVQGWQVEAFSAAELAAHKTKIIRQVNDEAEQQRQQYITPGAGQSLTYQQKATEADAIAQDASPDPARYPYVAGRATVTGASLVDAAAEIRATRDAWLPIGAAIEAKREAAKLAIEAATDRAGVDSAALVEWHK